MVIQVIPVILCRTLARNFPRGRRGYVKISSASFQQLQLFDSLKKKQESICRNEAHEMPVAIRLSSGQSLEGKAGYTTPLHIAQRARVKGALVSKVNGELWDLGQPLQSDCELQFLGFDTPEGRQAAWRTGACVLGTVLETVLGAAVCREGASELGLYCDHVLKNSVLSLSDVEEKCMEAAAQKLPLIRLNLKTEDIHQLFQTNELRLRLVEEQVAGPVVSVYRCGDSIGVCDGPLLPHTGYLKIFKMLQISPVTLSNQTEASGLMRLLGVAFPGVKEIEEWEREQEEARKRDHRRIGKDQELYFFSDISPGSCFFLPKGAHIYNTLTDFIKSEYRKRGFTEVVTPTLYSTALWERSGHWEHYSDNMFTVTSEGAQTYALKPMNCPAHCLMFEHRVRSWRELPLRWADFGALHRNELSGALGGLTRVRRFCQDDAHIFCTPEQV